MTNYVQSCDERTSIPLWPARLPEPNNAGIPEGGAAPPPSPHPPREAAQAAPVRPTRQTGVWGRSPHLPGATFIHLENAVFKK